MTSAERRELLRLCDAHDARRIQNVLVNAVSRICSTKNRTELADFISIAMECLTMMPLVREHLDAEARRLAIQNALKLQGQCLQCGQAIHSTQTFCSAQCESDWNATDLLP